MIIIKQVVFVVEDKIHPNRFLQLNKVYDVIGESGYEYYISNDNTGGRGYDIYAKNKFITLQEWRDKQMNTILNEPTS